MVFHLIACEEGCTGILFEDIDAMSRSISRISLDDFVPLPWNPLILQENTSLIFEVQLSERKRENSIRGMLINAPNLLPLAQILLQRVNLNIYYR